MTEEIIIRDNSKGIPEETPETPCDKCPKTATYRIRHFKAGKRRAPVELHFCDLHYTRFELESHRYAYSVRQLKG